MTGDAVIGGLTAQMEHVQGGIDDARHRFAADSSALKRFIAEQQPELDRLREKISKRRAAMKKEMTARRQFAQAAAGKNLNTSIAVLESQRKVLTERVARYRAEEFGR